MIGLYARDTVTWVKSTGTDDYGEPTAPTETDYAARVIWQERKAINQFGQEVLASGEIKAGFKPNPVTDKIRVDGVDYTIVSVREHKVYGRISHYRIFIQ